MIEARIYEEIREKTKDKHMINHDYNQQRVNNMENMSIHHVFHHPPKTHLSRKQLAILVQCGHYTAKRKTLKHRLHEDVYLLFVLDLFFDKIRDHMEIMQPIKNLRE